MLKDIFLNWMCRINEREYPYKTFGIFGLLTYPGYYLVWTFSHRIGYENLTLRLVACLLCIPFIFEKKWPVNLRIIKNLYWYLIITYCLPFFFTFLLFKNQFSFAETMNASTVLILMIFLLETIPLIISLLVGIIGGFSLFIITTNYIYFPPVDYVTIVITYLTIILFGSIFAYRTDAIYKEKLQTMKSLAANIAHELRTPLAAVQSGIRGVNKYFPRILKGYTLAKENNLPVEYISRGHLKILDSAFENIYLETNHAGVIVEMFLTNIKHPDIKAGGSDIFPISDCIKYALKHYPLLPSQKEKINLEQSNQVDFQVRGDKILIVHILYNLIKNALYFIDKAEKGCIFIWLEGQPTKNILHFKDTGLGIPKKYLPHIFERFFSRNTHQGTGVGLAFCKMVMESVGGNITCESREGEYTHFKLEFPKLSNALFLKFEIDQK